MEAESETILGEYEAWLRSWASAKTIRDRVMAVRTLLADCGGVERLDARAVQAFIAKPRRDGKDKSTWSKATYRGHVKSFAEFLLAGGYVTEDPMQGVRAVTRPSKAPRPLSDSDVARVLEAARGDVRDWIVVALSTGLRVSELAQLRGEDVSEQGIYVDGKGGTGTTLPSHPDVLAIAARKPRRGYWWPGSEDGHITSQRISRVVGDLFGDLGIKGSVHRCRHTYATRLIRAGIHIRTVQRLMRHASLATTEGYTAVYENELHAAVMVLPSVEPPHDPAA